jgi:excinuclease UvrABC helicase subunit UvrB
VYIDGQPRAWWRNTEGSQKTSLWYEPTISIPAQFITKEKTDIRIEVVDKHRVTYFVSYYWFYQ